MNIKVGLEKEYEKCIKSNSNDDYSLAAIEVMQKVMENLNDETVNPETAFNEGIKDSGITVFQAGWISSVIVHFHIRGDEYKKWWNKDCGGTGEEKGTINPAIFTIG